MVRASSFEVLNEVVLVLINGDKHNIKLVEYSHGYLIIIMNQIRRRLPIANQIRAP